MESAPGKKTSSPLSPGEQKAFDYAVLIAEGRDRGEVLQGLGPVFITSVDRHLENLRSDNAEPIPRVSTPEANPEIQRRLIDFLEKNFPSSGETIRVSEFYKRLNQEFGLSYSFTHLMQIADHLGVRIGRRSEKDNHIGPANETSPISYYYPTNTIHIYPERFFRYQDKISPDLLAFRSLSHEIIHAYINKKFPAWNFDTHSAPRSRQMFEMGLRPLLTKLEEFRGKTGNSRVDKLVEIVLRPDQSPEEIITYTLTDSDFQDFMRKSNQMESLHSFFRLNDLRELEKLMV